MTVSIDEYVNELDKEQLENCMAKCSARINKLNAEPKVKLAIVTSNSAINEAFFPIEEYDVAVKCLVYIVNGYKDKRDFDLGIYIASFRVSEANEMIAETRKRYAEFLKGV